MIKRLRRKFIAMAMASVVLVLVLLLAAINIANFARMDRTALEKLQMLSENHGNFPDGVLPELTQGQLPQRRPHNDRILQWFSEETPFETRFFWVKLAEDGTCLNSDMGNIAAIAEDEAVAMADKIRELNYKRGYYRYYRFIVNEGKTGTYYVFLDCKRDLESVAIFLRNSLLMAVFGVAAVFLVVLLLSGFAIRPIKESYEKQKQFITNAGHELKTPLTVISSCAHVLELEQGANKWTDGIHQQVERLGLLTRELISLSRIDERSETMQKAPLELTDTVQKTLEPYVLVAQQSDVKLNLNLQAGLRYTGSAQLLQQLCTVLVDNAIKYSVPGSTVEFVLQKRGRRIYMTCENLAHSMPQGDLNNLFDRFYRGDASRSNETEGHGLGLSLARVIVEAHGGRIEASSREGAHFLITVQL